MRRPASRPHTLDRTAAVRLSFADSRLFFGAGVDDPGNLTRGGIDDFIITALSPFEDFLVCGGPNTLAWMDAADGILDGQLSLVPIYSDEEVL